MDTNIINRRDIMMNIINDIYHKIPDNDAESKFLGNKFKSLINKLAYTAPEITDSWWSNVYNTLYESIPSSESGVDEPPLWSNEIREIWNNGNIRLNSTANQTNIKNVKI